MTLIGIIILKSLAIILKPYKIKKLNITFRNKDNNFFIFYHLIKTMVLEKIYSTFLRSLSALSKVIASIYSISAPIGTPLAIFDIFISKSPNILFIYKAVVSPSILGRKAKIISFG